MKVTTYEGLRPIKNWATDIEAGAWSQAVNLASLPFIAGNGIALMPDAHMGKGSTVGSVIATDRAIIPAAVGVDIGCGMNAVRLSIKAHQLPDSLANLRHSIERGVPLGAGGRHQNATKLHENFSRIPVSAGVGFTLDSLRGGYKQAVDKAISQLGTLGSGNHFIELCVDEADDVWVMLHSGSRGVGNMIGMMFIERAKKTMEKFFITLPDTDLSYLPEDTDDFNQYVAAVQWAQDYALENRHVMMGEVLRCLGHDLPFPWMITQEAINCHHNYVTKENHFGRNLWVTRKGAIDAHEGVLGIIPGSMGTKSYIVRGLGNAESYCSCSHGAGRRMSRTQARKLFTIADLEAQTMGVECRKDEAVLDEIPGSYKDIDAVMANQTDLVEVLHTLKAVLCVKGA